MPILHIHRFPESTTRPVPWTPVGVRASGQSAGEVPHFRPAAFSRV